MIGKNASNKEAEAIIEGRHNHIGKFVRIFSILMLLLCVVLFLSGNAYAYNTDTHKTLVNQSLEVLKNSGAPNAEAAYNFFTGNDSFHNPNNLNISNYSAEIGVMWPDLHSTTEPDERSIENFLSEAQVYPLLATPIPEDNLTNITWCIETLFTKVLEQTGKQNKSAEETLIFTEEDPNRAFYHLFAIFPVSKFNLPPTFICTVVCNYIWDTNCSMCRDLGKTYEDYYLMADRFSHTSNYKTLEYANYAVEEYRQDDVNKSFIWLLRSLQGIQHSTCPFKDRRPPEYPPTDVNDAESRWCNETVHGVAYVEYCDNVSNWIDTIPNPTFPPIEIEEHPGTFLDAVNYTMLNSSTNASEYFKYVDGIPYPDNIFDPLHKPPLSCVCEDPIPDSSNPNDNHSLVANELVPKARYWQAYVLYNFYNKTVLGKEQNHSFLVDVHLTEVQWIPFSLDYDYTNLTVTRDSGSPFVDKLFCGRYNYYDYLNSIDIDIQENVSIFPIIPGRIFDKVVFVDKNSTAIISEPHVHIPNASLSLENGTSAHIYYSPFVGPVDETKYLNSISITTQPVDISKIRFVQNAVNEKWVKGSKWPISMELMYWQKSTKYLIEIDIDGNGNVARVGFRRWGNPITEIPYKLAEQSLASLPPGFAISP